MRRCQAPRSDLWQAAAASRSLTSRKFFEQTHDQCDQIFRNFSHSGTTLKNFGHFECVDLVFGKILSSIWHILNNIGQIVNVENGQILNKQSSHLVTLLTKPRVRNCNRDRPKSAKSASISMTANEK